MTPSKLLLQIDALNSQGAGVGRHEGKVYFVPWALPGDEVWVEVTVEKKNYAEAKLISIEKNSPDRVDAPCPYFLKCGGCQLQHLDYQAQLKAKKGLVEAALKRIAKIPNPNVLDTIPSPQIWNYRNRIQLHQDTKGKIGFHQMQSHDVVAIESCLIAEPSLNQMLSELRKNPPKFEGRSLEIRSDEHDSFSQVNSAQNEKLQKLVLEFLDLNSKDRVLDLYCGSGNFTFPIAEKVDSVVGIEKSSESIQAAKAIDWEKKNIRWIRDSVLTGLNSFQSPKFNKAVIDPPRKGMAEEIEGLRRFNLERLVYVSCDPGTFARDLIQLAAMSYQLEICQPVDMFPHTAHVELVAKLVFKNG